MTPSEYNTQAELMQLMLDGKIDELIAEFGEAFLPFIENVLNMDDYGEKGFYSFFCKQCGTQWSFSTKVERKMFERLHKLTGCAFRWTEDTDTSNRGHWFKTRTDRAMPYEMEEMVQKIITKHKTPVVETLEPEAVC